MSGHADTIRRALTRLDYDRELLDGRDYDPSKHEREIAALNALVAELQQQADRIAWLEGDVAQRRIENQRLRDALERCAAAPFSTNQAYEIACAALDGTPSEDA